MGWKAWNQELRQIVISLSDFSLVFCYSEDKSNECLPINDALIRSSPNERYLTNLSAKSETQYCFITLATSSFKENKPFECRPTRVCPFTIASKECSGVDYPAKTIPFWIVTLHFANSFLKLGLLYFSDGHSVTGNPFYVTISPELKHSTLERNYLTFRK